MKLHLVLSVSAILFCGFGKGASAKVSVPGDLDFDGSVTTKDVIRALQISLGTITPNESEMEMGDVLPAPGVGTKAGWRYGDGRITLADTLKILQASVGLDTLGENWMPALIRWQGQYLPLDSGNAVVPGGAAWVEFDWQGIGPANWRADPPGDATLWLLDHERSALLVGAIPDNNFTLSAGTAPFVATSLGAVRATLPAFPVDLVVTTDLVDYPPLRPPQITLKATNHGTTGFVSEAGVFLYAFDNESHREIWETRDPQWSQKVEIPAGGTHEWTLSWDWKGNDGVFVQPVTYTLFARLGLGDPTLVISRGVEITRVAVE